MLGLAEARGAAESKGVSELIEIDPHFACREMLESATASALRTQNLLARFQRGCWRCWDFACYRCLLVHATRSSDNEENR